MPSGPGRRPVEVDDVARYPLPGTAVPTSPAFSPDGRLLTYLHSPDRSLARALFAHDVATGEVVTLAGGDGGVTEANLSREEQLERERRRELGLGVTRYAWAEAGGQFLVPQPDGLHVGGPSGGLRRVVEADGAPLLDPRLSPDGSLVAYVCDAELHVAGTGDDGPAPRQVTTGARGTGRTNGLAEFVAQEEMGRAHGYWWSKDGRRLAFTEVDETHIPVYRIAHQGSDEVGEDAWEDHRYPFAGAANARVRLGVVGLEGGDVTWMPVGGDDDSYLARVDWDGDGRLIAQVQNRAQTRLDVVALDPETGGATVLLTEESDVWINLHDCFRPLEAGGFLWASERTGFRHLELRGRDGALVRVLTAGEWLVETVAAVDEAQGTVWFTGTLAGPLERHLYAVALDGSNPPRRVTTEPGVHAVVVDADRGHFVDTHSSLGAPPTVALRSLADGALVRMVHDEVDPAVAELDLRPPELTVVETAHGVTLHAAVFRPDGEGPFPAVFAVYGGPHVQRVTDSWATTVAMRSQYLRRLGFAVITVDNRGSAGRGLAFEGAVRHDLGNIELRDQVDAVRHFVDAGLVDRHRVGIAGWSYGGYLSAMAVARAPETFHAAVAGAPVTHWDGYDTHYTERYMGLPSENADGYERSSVMHHVDGMTGHLMLVHGLIDENVHFRHTARLVNALVRARKHYDLVLFPDERHVPRSEADRIYMEERVRDFLLAHLEELPA